MSLNYQIRFDEDHDTYSIFSVKLGHIVDEVNKNNIRKMIDELVFAPLDQEDISIAKQNMYDSFINNECDVVSDLFKLQDLDRYDMERELIIKSYTMNFISNY